MRRSHLGWRVAVIAAILGAALAFSPPALAAKSAVYNRSDVAIDLQSNGDLDVAETYVVMFSGGGFSNGHRMIPLARTDGIDGVTVAEKTASGLTSFKPVDLVDVPDNANSFNVMTAGSDLAVNWRFAESDLRQRTFVITYVVHGALRAYPGATPPNQQIWWTAVGSDLTNQTPVQASTVTIHLPRAVDLAKTQTGEDGIGNASAASRDGRTFTFTHGSFSAGSSMIVRLIFPPVIPGAAAPSWQAGDDASRAVVQKTKERNALILVISLIATFGVLIVGGLLLYALWYTKGRDPHTGLVADFLPAPPDELPPGVAGTLLDERADEQDVVATFLDLARRGVMTMTDAGLKGDEKRATGRDYDLTIGAATPSLAPYEATIFRAVFGADAAVGTTVRLSAAGKDLRASFPKVEEQLYCALVDRGLFIKSPEETRNRWRRAAKWLVTGFLVAGTIVGFAFSWFVTIPCLAAALLAAIGGRLGRSMPRKTQAGAEAAATWRAFQRYLKEIDRYEHVAEKTTIFERYLAFAVALGVDSQWVFKFRSLGVPLPSWLEGGLQTGPLGRAFTGWDFGPAHRGGGRNNSGGGVDLPDVKMPKIPSLQSMSDKAGGGVQTGSNGVMTLLNLAGVILEVVSSVSGGKSGGSSGGGGGGFD